MFKSKYLSIIIKEVIRIIVAVASAYGIINY